MAAINGVTNHGGVVTRARQITQSAQQAGDGMRSNAVKITQTPASNDSGSGLTVGINSSSVNSGTGQNIDIKA